MPTKDEDVSITFRAPKSLADAFTIATQNNDDTKSQVLRAAVRRYLDDHNQKLL